MYNWHIEGVILARVTSISDRGRIHELQGNTLFAKSISDETAQRFAEIRFLRDEEHHI